MEVTFKEASFLKKFIKSFDRVVDEFLFICDENGIRYAGTDGAQIVLVYFELRLDVFQSYTFHPLNGATDIVIGLSQQLLSKYLQIIPGNIPVVLQDSGDRFKIHATEEGVDYSSCVGVLQLQREFHELPKNEIYCLHVDFPAGTFEECIKDLSSINAECLSIIYNPSITVKQQPAVQQTQQTQLDDGGPTTVSLFDDCCDTTTPPTLTLEGTSDIGTVSTTFTSGQDGFNDWKLNRPIKQSFPLNFLREHALKFCALSSKATLSLGGYTNPLKLTFPLHATTSDNVGEKFIKENIRCESNNENLNDNQRSFIAFYLSSLRDKQSDTRQTDRSENRALNVSTGILDITKGVVDNITDDIFMS